MVCCPQEGTYFLEEFDRLLTALERPDHLDDPNVREVVMGYFRSKRGPAPAIFDLLATEFPEKNNILIARLLARPQVDWAQDRENILQQYNPEFLRTPRFPSTLALPPNMIEGLKYLQSQAQKSGNRSRSLKAAGTRMTGLSHAGAAGRSAFTGATALPLSDDEYRKQRNRMKRKRKAKH